MLNSQSHNRMLLNNDHPLDLKSSFATSPRLLGICGDAKACVNVEQIAQMVAEFVNTLSADAQQCYPVLGACGPDYFIEIATGPIETRTILRTMHIEICEDLPGMVVPVTVITAEETLISIIDAAGLISILALIQSALGKPPTVLHPLDETGNFFRGWGQARVIVSRKERPLHIGDPSS